MAREPPALSDYGAHLALLVPQNTWALAALLSANINMMRRHAVFAYLFAVGYSLQLWREEVIGEDDYKNSRDAIELRRGLWLGYPEREDQPRTLVIAILEGM